MGQHQAPNQIIFITIMILISNVTLWMTIARHHRTNLEDERNPTFTLSVPYFSITGWPSAMDIPHVFMMTNIMQKFIGG